jgi:hypothetical protein
MEGTMSGISSLKFAVATGLVAGLGAALVTPHAHADAKVSFIAPDKYIDFPTAEWERVEPQRTLTAHFEKLSEKLAKGETLKVDILEIDLAGRLEPTRSQARELRILRGGADWPTMKFRYAIERDGKTIASGEANINDMNYLQRFNRYNTSEPLRYEKRMIDEWFAKTFIETTASK